MNLLSFGAKVLRRLLRQPDDLRGLADRVIELAPSVEELSPPAIYFPDELDRVTGFADYSDKSIEWARIAGGKVVHQATRAYEISGARLTNGCVRSRLASSRIVPQSALEGEASQSEYLASGALVSTVFGSVYFGHWMTDDLSRHLLAETLDQPLVMARRKYHHEDEYSLLLGLKARRIERAHVGRLTWIDDVGQHEHKRRRYEELRRRLHGRLGTGSHSLVYLRRGLKQAAAARVLTNASGLEDTLKKLGFHIVDIDACSPLEIAEQVNGAKVVVGTEGSHMAHALYSMGEGAALVILQPPFRFNNIFKGYADCLRMRYGFLVGTEVEQGFVIQSEQLSSMLDHLRP